MAQYIIQGGNKLKGKISLSGNKNSILPCLAASLLTEEEVLLTNVPNIIDVEVMLQIMESLGSRVSRGDHQIRIQTSSINTHVIGSELTKRLRASVLLAGALLGRIRKVEFCHPGGDVIGRRDIDFHLIGFKQLGFNVRAGDREYKITNGRFCPQESKIFLEIPTVTGTENLIMAAVTKEGTTVIRNAASEPHVIDLCQMLASMGAKISGIGSSTLVIEGVKKIKGTEFKISPDNIEFGTYAIAAAVTGGEIEILDGELLDIDPLIWPLQKMGLEISKTNQAYKISPKRLTAIPKLITNVWPGFPTDMMSVAIVLATQARGVSLFHDWLYESRMFFVDKLISMGAQITIADPHRVLVYGPSKLYGRNLESPDIRAGMALVLAALAANGQSVINRAELIERGYEDVVGKLSLLGASIEKID